MLEKLRHRIPEHWKTKLAPLAEWLILAEPQLRLTDGMDRDAIKRKVDVYVKRCVRWQAKERRQTENQRRQKPGQSPTIVWLLQPSRRWLVVFLAVLVAVPLVASLLWLLDISLWLKLGEYTHWQLTRELERVWSVIDKKQTMTDWLKPNTIWSALVPLLLVAPVAYVLWYFRDQNTLWQIENQRKDINLKDFQKLAEWASGQHLQEDKVIEQTKRTEKATANGSEVTTETVMTREGSAPPNHARSVNKRTGGESLQVAAVYQLQAFLDGEFGKHFQRPAFQLLKSLWEGLVQEHIKKLESIPNKDDAPKITTIFFNDWCKELQTLTKTPIGQVLNEIIAKNYELHFHENPLNTHRKNLAGINANPINKISLNLAGLHLNEANLQNTALPKAKPQGVQLNWAKLEGANLQ